MNQNSTQMGEYSIAKVDNALDTTQMIPDSDEYEWMLNNPVHQYTTAEEAMVDSTMPKSFLQKD